MYCKFNNIVPLCHIAKHKNKASLSFGRTSAGTVWCFLGMFHTIETNAKEYSNAELALNYMDQKKSGIKF